MATQHTRVLGRILVAPSVILLFAWMIVPLAMTIYFSTLRYNLLNPGLERFVGAENYTYFLTDPAFIGSLQRWREESIGACRAASRPRRPHDDFPGDDGRPPACDS